MNIQDWHTLTTQQKYELLIRKGRGINYIAIWESLSYLDAVIAYTIHVKYIERLPSFGVKAVAEHLRYRTKASDGSILFKVNNNLTSDINHWLLRAFPELEGFYQVRSIGGDA